MAIDLSIKKFNDLDLTTLYAILQLRNEVFIVEQNCAYQDLDGYDIEGIHMHISMEKALAAYCRILPPGIKQAEACITRVISNITFRRQGYGRSIMKHAITYIELQWPDAAIKISAQAHLQAFYESFDFIKTSDIYLEDNIPHIDMIRSK